MNKYQHKRLAVHYHQRWMQIADYSRSVNGNLTHQQALDYAAIWQKHIDHKRAEEALLTDEERDTLRAIWAKQQRCSKLGVPRLAFVTPPPRTQWQAEDLARRGFLMVSRYYPDMPAFAIRNRGLEAIKND